MAHEVKPLAYQALDGISEKTLAVHHDKLYAGYVAKAKEIGEKISVLSHGGDVSSANQSYSELRALKDGETFAVNGIYLHEWYFDTLGGNGQASGPLVEKIVEQYGSLENFTAYFSANGMAARGWVILCWDLHEQALRIYNADAHNQGGVWGCLPILVLDVYEHAYFMDYGSDRKAYIASWWKNLNWDKANELYSKALKMSQVS
jgi:Fe-Mn family superoxide dismutase